MGFIKRFAGSIESVSDVPPATEQDQKPEGSDEAERPTADKPGGSTVEPEGQ